MHTIYNRHTGKIMGILDCSDNLLEINLANLPEGQGAITHTDIYNGENHYYDLANSILARPTITAEPNKLTLSADGTDSIIITELPVPCTVKVEESVYEVDDGEFEFTINIPGTYTITVQSFPYLDKSWEIAAI